MTYGKFLTNSSGLTPLDTVFVTNVLSLPFIAVFAVVSTERKLLPLLLKESELHWTAASCLVGTGVAFTSWKLRSTVSATTFTVVNLLNGFAQIFVSAILFRDTSTVGNAVLVLSLASGMMYSETPLRIQTEAPAATDCTTHAQELA